MESVNQYLDAPINPYAGKNVKLTKTGAIGYVTENGVYKWWDSGENLNSSHPGCPNPFDVVQIDGDFDDFTTVGAKIATNPPMVIGSAMLRGQSCGNEGKNVIVGGTALQTPLYMGCFENAEMSTQPGTDFTWETCRDFAFDSGSRFFSAGEDGTCSIANDNTKMTASSEKCVKVGDIFKGSGNVAAVYDMSAMATAHDDIGKIGFVDSNADLHEYPASMIAPSDTYQTVPEYDSPGYDLVDGGLLQNTTVDACKTACNSRIDCAGFAFDKPANNCRMKSVEMWPKGTRTPNINIDLYHRKPALNNDVSCSKDYTLINGVTWNGYHKGDLMTPDTKCGLGAAIAQSQKIADLNRDSENAAAYASIDDIARLQSQITSNKRESTDLSAHMREYYDTEAKLKQSGSGDGDTREGLTNIVTDSTRKIEMDTYWLGFWVIIAAGLSMAAISRIRK